MRSTIPDTGVGFGLADHASSALTGDIGDQHFAEQILAMRTTSVRV